MGSSALLNFAAAVQGKSSCLSFLASLFVLGFFLVIWLVNSQLIHKNCNYILLDWITAIILFLGTCIILQLDCLSGNWAKVWLLVGSIAVGTIIGLVAWHKFCKTLKYYAGYHPFIMGVIPFSLSSTSIYSGNWMLLVATIIVTTVFIAIIWGLEGAFKDC